MIRTHAAQTSFLTLAAAWLLAATQIQRPEGWSLAGLYGYWTVRIMIEAGLFVAFAELIGRLPGLKPRILLTAFLAAIVSLVPFALSITAMDLILGLPELGGSVSFDNAQDGASAGQSAADSRVGSFFREILYLSDNHLALCLILTAPKLFEAFRQTGLTRGFDPARTETPADDDPSDTPHEPDPVNAANRSTETGYLRHLDHPLNGNLLRIEAQEHYVRLISDLESRMVLYRFNDIVAELPDRLGMQVHRSHWVAFAAVESLHRDSGRQWLNVTDGSKIPVSRKYSEDVRSRFGSMEPDTKGTVDEPHI
ncbi:MAG: LytTR family transcriptional regulator [Alphaproteobacteria bacterium]|nr:LytTR family transcriptional regulator [Alphaproteobacteria bacterium]